MQPLKKIVFNRPRLRFYTHHFDLLTCFCCFWPKKLISEAKNRAFLTYLHKIGAEVNKYGLKPCANH